VETEDGGYVQRLDFSLTAVTAAAADGSGSR